MNIAKTAAKGVSWTAGSTLFRAVLQVAQLLIVARYLTPTELGVLAIVNLVVGFAQIFGDAGLSNAIIYFKNLSKTQLNSLYLINIGFGLSLTLVVLLLSIPISIFFEMPDLVQLLIALSPVFFIRSLFQQPMALLQQNFKFNLLAKAETIAALIGFLSLILCLNYDMRMSAIVISQLIAASVLGLLIISLSKTRLPNFSTLDWKSIKEPIKYGFYQASEACINFMSAQFDQLLIGKLMGAESLGVYSYIKALVFRPAMQLINPVVHKVTFPLMSHYKDQHAIADIYWQILRVLSLLNLPLYLAFMLYPGTILGVVFGAEWAEYAELLRWLAVYMLFISLINPVGAMLRATGEVKRAFWWNIVVTITRPAVVIVSFPFGLEWIVKALVAQQVILFFAHWLVLVKPVGKLSLRRFLSAFKQSIVLCTLSLIFVSICHLLLPNVTDITEIVLLVITYTLMLVPIVKKTVQEIRNR
ncbi:MOP flippase family protein [Shewanella sp. Scap07]|uniref:MOP flippase family protein n=1 Tax=Shewanella sp. Scap07 TaxID=2589987 RepID=UPI0015BC19DF|nr:MOP flippase family protein [Shewanella sp. Scap07]QLE86062.1 MOP flippase family protein [Shewanella sp. Scap07]